MKVALYSLLLLSVVLIGTLILQYHKAYTDKTFSVFAMAEEAISVSDVAQNMINSALPRPLKWFYEDRYYYGNCNLPIDGKYYHIGIVMTNGNRIVYVNGSSIE